MRKRARSTVRRDAAIATGSAARDDGGEAMRQESVRGVAVRGVAMRQEALREDAVRTTRDQVRDGARRGRAPARRLTGEDVGFWPDGTEGCNHPVEATCCAFEVCGDRRALCFCAFVPFSLVRLRA